MNIIDFILVIIIILSVRSGFQRGFVLGIFDLLSWFGSLLITLLIYPYVVQWMEQQSSTTGVWTIPLAFLLSFLTIRITVGLMINWVLEAFPGKIHGSMVNKSLGVLPGLINGLVTAALIATLLLILPLSDGISAKSQDSRMAILLSEPVAEIEDRLSPVFDEAVRKRIGRITVDPESEKFIKLPYTVKEPRLRPDLEEKMLELLNEERARKGLTSLKADPEMREVARAHSADMFSRGYFSHYTPEKTDPFDRMKAKNVRFLTAGENLSLARTLMMAHEGLMNSPGHRANILQPAFGRVGIGILDGGIYGIMVTQNFRN